MVTIPTQPGGLRCDAGDTTTVTAASVKWTGAAAIPVHTRRTRSSIDPSRTRHAPPLAPIVIGRSGRGVQAPP
ncbi:hypothetical protein GCM10018962_64150 [Dactylosporangium matsuzakiense]|uniref:Uncharacterized protein n=1 Tax=Dactylosporangium matsuzakiense TaxID=53360 RepID=A0A9W6NLP9_9ACTN|nr:hypothetical protein GCM10017581_028480 [Dactylosporangium matsuzakiense]